jgi:hypothetical protein
MKQHQTLKKINFINITHLYNVKRHVRNERPETNYKQNNISLNKRPIETTEVSYAQIPLSI